MDLIPNGMKHLNLTFIFHKCVSFGLVYDSDAFSPDDRLAYFCLPMTTMQTGYRHIHLRAINNNLIQSTLFIHVDIKSI